MEQQGIIGPNMQETVDFVVDSVGYVTAEMAEEVDAAASHKDAAQIARDEAEDLAQQVALGIRQVGCGE